MSAPEDSLSLQRQPPTSLKRSISKVDDPEEQPVRSTAFVIEEPPSPKAARLYDWVLRNAVAFDRKRTRSDSFLLELEKGNNNIEARRSLLENHPQDYPESDHSSRTPNKMVDTTKDPNYRVVNLKSNGVVVENMTPTLDAEVKAFLDQEIFRHRDNYTALSEDEQKANFQVAKTMSDKMEGSVQVSLPEMPMFPKNVTDIIMKNEGLDVCNCLMWSSEALPKLNVNHAISCPTPDLTVAFTISTLEEHKRVLEQAPFQKWAMPTSSDTLCFPFFSMEIKAPKGQTMYYAENQLARAATHVVSTMRKLYEYAGKAEQVTKTNTMFIECVTFLTETYYWVAYYDKDKARYLVQQLEDLYRPGKPEKVDRFRMI